MKRERAELYTVIKKDIAENELLKLRIEYDMPSNVQNLSFTPICHSGESKMESTALEIIAKCEEINNILNIQRKELEVIDVWIETHKESDQEVLIMKIKHNTGFKSISDKVRKTEGWVKNKYYKMFN